LLAGVFGQTAPMEDEGRTETERENEEPESKPDEGEPWAKTSSGDADEITEDSD
jgi:hypothetical protein